MSHTCTSVKVKRYAVLQMMIATAGMKRMTCLFSVQHPAVFNSAIIINDHSFAYPDCTVWSGYKAA